MTEDDFRALVQRARCAVTGPTDRQSLRDAKRARRATIDGYLAALRGLSPRDAAAVLAHSRALSAETAANRAEAKELRELLAALVGADHPPIGDRATERNHL
ncbi:hypothetical protein OR221_0363 [Microbacterium laevaniformans OR221]|jgi:hypothetical protein|nr:hypothetical protein OR221_0363 [Microbacterium laevaniformans OR221]